MRNDRSALAIVLLLIAQLFCVLPGQGQPTPAPGITASPPEVTVTSADDSVGTIDLMNSQVQTGPPENLQYLEGQRDFYNGDGVRVTEGGKGKLTMDDGSFLTLFNETEIGGVNVITSPPETDLFLQNGGFLGHVPPGPPVNVNMPNGAKITILGTYFFVVFNSETQVATAGNFDGRVLYTPPGGAEQDLPRGNMVNIPAEGEVVLMELPFTHEQFEAAVDSAGAPTAGLTTLVQEYQIEPIAEEPAVPYAGQEVMRMTHDARVLSVAFSPDGAYVVSSGDDNTARLWETFTGKEVARMIHDRIVYSVAFSPDGKNVVSGSADSAVRVWDAFAGREVARMIHERGSWVTAVAFSPDGQYIVSAGCDYTVHVWEVFTGEEVASMTHDDGNCVWSVDFSPDGQFVVSASLDRTVRVWEALTGKEVVRMNHDEGVQSVAFSPDGKYVVSGSYDNTARVWDVATGQEVMRMPHNDAAWSVAFSPDGQYVVSGGAYLYAHVWETFTGKEIARMNHETSVWSVAFSPDGQSVGTGSQDNTVRVWSWQPQCQIGC